MQFHMLACLLQGDAAAERLVKLVGAFLAHTDADRQEDCEVMVQQVLSYLATLTTARDKLVRGRACRWGRQLQSGRLTCLDCPRQACAQRSMQFAAAHW